MRISLRSLIAAAALTVSTSAFGAVVTQWNFNSNPADTDLTTGTNVPSTGTGTLTLVGGITSLFASGTASGGSSDPVTVDNTGLSTLTYPSAAASAGTSGTAGVRFAVSTATVAAADPLYIYFDLRQSNTSSRFLRVDYTTDGSTYIAGPTFEASLGGDQWYNQRLVDLSAVPAAKGNANFAFQIVSVFAPTTSAYTASTATSTYAATGTYRFDQVTLTTSPIPEPATAGLVLLAGAFLRRKR